MALPINIDELINGKTVEWERIEFRKGWNPERTLRTICAFANDFNNWGGGYLVIGVDESDGHPVLPPEGLKINQIDLIQKELNDLCRKIIPNYFPIVEPVDFKGKKILVLWCPGGSVRPYKAPDSLGKNPRYIYYIRRLSSTVQPTPDEELEILSMSNRIPFDDQVNHQAKLSDLDLSSIKIFLNEIKSDLENQMADISINDLCRRMNIAEGADENLIPKNVGILFFAKDVQRFFPQAKIEIVHFEDESGTKYTEKIFSGQIHNQLRGALGYLKDSLVKESVIKRQNRAESDRFFNYPYEAIEEALGNAVYHRGYDNDSPIEVRIFPGHIDIISFPGPLPPLDREKLKKLKFDVRKYRNRRIGEFLKELHLTEGRATGIPSILKALKKNGSPKPVFDTDKDRTYFKTSFKIHKEFKKWHQVGTKLALSWRQVGAKLGESRKEIEDILKKCKNPQSISILLKSFELKDKTKFRRKYINPLIELNLLSMTIPDKPKSSKQKYKTTEEGERHLEILSRS
jgi:ATP-dependent DNA helicase RecG